jgi:hypothetical protein
VLLAGFGGSSAGAPRVAVEITVTKTGAQIDWPLCKRGQVSTAANPCSGTSSSPLPPAPPRTHSFRSFSLTCDPTGGNLPLADRICANILRYPRTMVNPPPRKADIPYHICSGCALLGHTEITVTTTANGATHSFDNTGGYYGLRDVRLDDAIRLYRAAIDGNEPALVAFEPGLRCRRDPAFLCVDAITYGVRDSIVAAGTATAFSRLQPISRLFPETIGTETCVIPVGGRAPARPLTGRCSVDVRGLEKPSSRPIVVFTETWPVSARATASHTWHVLLTGYRATSKVVSVTQSGALPPQAWRELRGR